MLNTSDDRKVLKIAARSVGLTVGSASAGVTLTGGNANLLLTPEGLAGQISGTATINLGAALTIPPVQISVSVNTMKKTVGGKLVGIAVDEDFTVGGETQTLSLPVGPYISVEVTGLTIEIGGQRLTADFSFERINVPNADGSIGATNTTRITLANGGLRIGTAERDFVVVSNAHGELNIAPGPTNGGIYGTISADIALNVPGVTLSGEFGVEFNTTGIDQMVGMARVKNGFKVSGTNVVFGVAGQVLTGDFTFEKATDLGADKAVGGMGANADSTVTVIGFRNVTLALGNGTTALVTAHISTGAILLNNQGLAASVTVSLTLAPAISQYFSLTGDITFQINTTPAAVNRDIKIGTTTITVNVPAGPYVRIQVGTLSTPAELVIMGQRVSAVVAFEQITTKSGSKVVRVAFDKVNIFLGDDAGTPMDASDDRGVTLTNGGGSLILTQMGFAGEFEGTVALTPRLADQIGVGLSVNLTIQINSLPVAVNEQFRFTGDVSVQTITQGAAAVHEVQKITVSATSGKFNLAYGSSVTPSLAFDSSAATVEAALDALGADVAVTKSGSEYTVTFNGFGNKNELVPNVRTLVLPAGQFFRVAAYDINITIDGHTLHGDLLVESASSGPGVDTIRGTADDPRKVKIGFANISYDGGSSFGGISNARGALILTTPASPGVRGVAGVLLGDISTAGGGFSLGASVGLQINTTGVAFTDSVNVNGTEIPIKVTASRFVLIANDLKFDFGDLLEIRGNFTIDPGTGAFTGSGLEIFVGKGPSLNADGTPNPNAIGLLIKNAAISFKRDSSGPGLYALYATGTLSLIGLTDWASPAP